MAALLAIIQLLLVPVLLIPALAVRFAGKSRPLNIVNYARVKDPSALHRWAGNRLAVLPLLFLISGLVSLHKPSLSAALLTLMIITMLVVAVSIAVGSEKFQSAP
ncbi:hypothetical protein [Stenotrophomonas lacuserhaii]|uniref:hypothetical protein n=1 Tax=Stenotrophomonas lacuserhaii TaxID=2760084 RepID=UPI0032EF6046